MKLHDLRPAPGSHKKKTRVGRGIAAGKGKTAGRGTKGQKARAGGKIPAWFEGGQTPLHVRIPKLRGFRNPFKIEYEIVNVGGITHLIEMGVLESGDMPGKAYSHNPLVRYFRVLGPGLVTGASDDDPSGIATYEIGRAHV